MKLNISIVLMSIFLATFAHAGIEGNYIYTLRGHKGSMNVVAEGTVIKVDISTVNTKNASDCFFEASGIIDGSTVNLVEKEEDVEDPNIIVITFFGNTANVNVVQMPYGCGVGATIHGKYTKKR